MYIDRALARSKDRANRLKANLVKTIIRINVSLNAESSGGITRKRAHVRSTNHASLKRLTRRPVSAIRACACACARPWVRG